MVQHLSNTIADAEMMNSNGKSKAIPLPPPPSSQFSSGNGDYKAYGGNQSFVQSSSDMVMGAPLVAGSSTYWDTSAVAGTSNSGARAAGVVGLTNIGNTCFMNSGLQCLLNTPSICEFFLKAKSFNSTSQKLALLNHFQCVVKQAWHGSNSKINLHEFKSCLAQIHSQFNDSRQHDCQEFLALLLDSLHEQLKKWTETQKELEVSRKKSDTSSSSTNIENERPHTPASWITDETPSSENHLVSSGKEISKTQSKGIKSSNLPDVVCSQNRKQSGLSLRSDETKMEDGESPGSPKKTKLDADSCESSETKRKLDLVSSSGEKLESSSRYLTKHSKKDENTSIPTHMFNGDGDHNSHSLNGDHLSVDDETEAAAEKLPPKRPTKAEEAARAENFWSNHINANNTVIAKTFQGLLKSTVVCSTCGYNSVTYEPFMYLSLPFPRVLERKLGVWFISMKDRRPVKLEVTVGLMDTVRKVKHEVGKIIPGEALGEFAAENLFLVEVCNYSVQRIIANSTLVRKLSDNRNLYLFQLNDNFDEKYSSRLSKEQTSFSFTGSFLNSDSVNSVSSTTCGQMNASTYLDEDWEQESKLTGSEGKEPYGPTLPCGSMEGKEPLDDLGWDEPTGSSDLPSVKMTDPTESAAGSQSPLSRTEGNVVAVESKQLVCGIEVGSSAESSGTADTTWSDDVCSLEAGSSEADDSGLGSGTSDTTESAIISGTCETADSPQFGTELTQNNLSSADDNCDLPELAPCPQKNDATNEAEATGGNDETFEDDADERTVVDDQMQDNMEMNDAEGICSSEGNVKDQLSGFPASVSSSAEIAEGDCWKSESKAEGIQSSTMQCIICLEDCNVSDMRQHVGCDCVICSNCVKSSIQHFVDAKDSSTNSKLKCATCMKIVHGSEFVPYRSSDSYSTKLTMEVVPLVFRLDPNPDTNNNSVPVPRIFGYPWLLKLPSTLPASEFHEYISEINPFPQAEYKVICVSTDGKSCGQCGYASPCSGCELPKTGNISLRLRTSLAISYSDLSVESLYSIEPTDMAIEEHSFGSSSWVTPGEPNYDIHDCLRAFSEIEHLDEQNPWFCPHCDKNQCATKALSVCHFPDYLIVYLKRFVFLDHSSNKLNNKLKFPISELDLSEYIAEEFSGKEWKYDLYGCICHFGSVSSGHYTAYGKNPVTDDWHYFNDDIVSQQCPKDLEHSSAYVLFYSRKSVKYDIPLQSKTRPLPGLNTLSHSRPVNIVAPTSKADDPWDPEDEEVSSSSTDFSFQPQPLHCNFSGGTVDSVEEMSLSVGNKLSPRPIRGDECFWDDDVKEDPIAVVAEDCKKEANSSYQSATANGEEDLVNDSEWS